MFDNNTQVEAASIRQLIICRCPSRQGTRDMRRDRPLSETVALELATLSHSNIGCSTLVTTH
eukprot:6203231-Pleurochrysis_carterae.AAC.1